MAGLHTCGAVSWVAQPHRSSKVVEVARDGLPAGELSDRPFTYVGGLRRRAIASGLLLPDEPLVGSGTSQVHRWLDSSFIKENQVELAQASAMSVGASSSLL